MTHSSQTFVDHFINLLHNAGPTGPTGKPLTHIDKVGTSRRNEVGPDNSWSHSCGPNTKSGPKEILTIQILATETSGTANFAEAADESQRGGAPSQWHAILAELERRNCPDWLSSERWEWLLGDAENFLSRWGSAAHALGWTALDLFGVHPIVPVARYDTTGLLLLIQGGAVVALTNNIATIRRPSGATMSFRRLDTDVLAVLLPSVLT